MIYKSILEIRSSSHKIAAILGHHQLSEISRRLGRTGGNLFRVSDSIHNADIVHIDHGNAGRNIRERHKGIGNSHDFVGILCIRISIAQDAAVGFSSDGTQISAFVRRGCANKGNINVDASLFNSADTAAVRVHDCNILQFSRADSLSNSSTDAGGPNGCYGTILDERNNGIVCFSERRGTYCNIANAHVVDFFHDQIYNIVSVAEMVVERNRHSVTDTAGNQRIMNRFGQLAAAGIKIGAYHGRSPFVFFSVVTEAAVKNISAGCGKDFFGNIPTY